MKKHKNPYLRLSNEVLAYEHRARIINSAPQDLSNTIQLIAAFHIEKDLGIRKLMAMKIVEFIDIQNLEDLDRILQRRDLADRMNAKELRDALSWRLEY